MVLKQRFRRVWSRLATWLHPGASAVSEVPCLAETAVVPTAVMHPEIVAASSVTVADWLKGQRQSPHVEFTIVGYGPHEGKVNCRLIGNHADNSVLTHGVGESPEDAFQNALQLIEQTIGTAWRPSAALSETSDSNRQNTANKGE